MDKRIWIIFLIMFTNLLGVGIIFPYLPYFAEHMGASPLIIGLLAITYPLCSIVSSPILGKISDTYGRRPVLLISLLGTIIGFVLLGVAKTLPLLFFARIMDGITAGNTPTAFAYIADITSKKERTHAVGVVSSSFWIGSAIGFALGGIASTYSTAAPGFIAAGTAGIGFFLALLFLPETVRSETVRKDHDTFFTFKGLFTIFLSPIMGSLILLVFVKEIIWWSFDATLALFAEHGFSLSPFETGLLFTYFGLIGSITQLVFLRKLKGVIEEYLMVFCLFAVGIGLLTVAIGESLLALIIGGTLCALGSSIVNPVLTSLISKRRKKHEQGRTMGLVQAVDNLGTIIGPMIALYFFGISLRLPFFAGAAIAIASAVFAFFYIALVRGKRSETS